MVQLPAIIDSAGPETTQRFVEFFTANIRNRNTRAAYGRACYRFLAWCDEGGIELQALDPVVVATYVELLERMLSTPTVKLHLAAIRMLFDWLVTGGILRMNPAAAVRGPRHSAKKGKTPVLDADQARQLLDSIRIADKHGRPDVVGLRDRALIALMLFTFGRVSAVASMRVGDYFQTGKRWSFRLREKGGKRHEVPAHHTAEEYLDAYLDVADICSEKRAPLFQTTDSYRRLTGRALPRRHHCLLGGRRND